MRGLIVDSSEQIRIRIEHLLKSLDFVNAIYHADSHSTAEIIYGLTSPDFVIVGIDFHQGDTVHFVKKIKHDFSTCVVIALVNLEDAVEVQKCKSHGVDFVLDKYHEFGKIPAIITLAAKLRKCKTLYEKRPITSVTEHKFAG
jgi:DNA-binding NarL/FixJ family response regulator